MNKVLAYTQAFGGMFVVALALLGGTFLCTSLLVAFIVWDIAAVKILLTWGFLRATIILSMLLAIVYVASSDGQKEIAERMQKSH